jgi:hypothetical protein
MHGQEPVILEGIPIYPPERRRMDPTVPPAPPPMEASEIEPFIHLTQPPPREEADPSPSSVEGPQEHQNEAAPSDEVD